VCWFSVGGIRDLARMYRLLELRRADRSDDGRVAVEADAPRSAGIAADGSVAQGAAHARD
jgi:hypothetical protein